jgi:signal transduction histidine kinase
MANNKTNSPLIKVLIVDDMLSIRKVVAELVKPLGASIHEAQNGHDAIEKIIRTEYDVVLMDIEMPLMDGITALKQIRNVHNYLHLPVIMMTGLDDDSLITEAFNEGANDYVRKPIHAEEVVARIRSVIERKRYEREMFLSKRIAERSNQAKSEFVTHLSHELKTPLNAIYGFAQLLEMETLNNEQMEFVRNILKACQNQQELINDSLDLAKIEAGSLNLKIEEVSLLDALKESFTITQPLADRSQIHLNRPKKAEADVILEADKKRLVQVLLNLITNAIKYNKPQGEVTFTIKPLPNNRIRLGITDTGIGIAEHQLPYLYESFNRLNAKDLDIEGTGIGLSLTKKMIEGMGGFLDVESIEGKGSTFWMELSGRLH